MDQIADRPSARWTSIVLVAGTLASVACLIVGFVLALLTGDTVSEDPRRLDLVLRSAVELHPWGWSMLGVLVLLATPAVGLIASALELRRLQPRTALLALLVLGILALAAAGALVAAR